MSVFFRATGWYSPPVVVATRFRTRWQGLRSRSNGRALLVRATSVHGLGMKESLWAIGLNRAGVVVGIRLLQPGRFVRVRGATWILEQSAAISPPPLGSVLAPTTRQR